MELTWIKSKLSPSSLTNPRSPLTSLHCVISLFNLLAVPPPPPDPPPPLLDPPLEPERARVKTPPQLQRVPSPTAESATASVPLPNPDWRVPPPSKSRGRS